MDDVAIASTPADAAAAVAVEQHHALLAGSLALRVEGLVAASADRNDDVARQAREHLVEWCRAELVPHALAEEKAMYPAAQALPEGRLLVKGMLAEHVVIVSLVDELDRATDPVRAAVAARSLQTLFESHLDKENNLVVPLLAGASDVSLAEVLSGMHELLGEASHPRASGAGPDEQSGCGGHSCSCGEVDPAGFPELDARQVPHAIRHATIFGALDAVPPGGGLVLVAPHDPLPLLAQIEQRAPGAFAVDYLERGPEAWRLEFVRVA
jgi:uncharacterized protein (DUF2249 family)